MPRFHPQSETGPSTLHPQYGESRTPLYRRVLAVAAVVALSLPTTAAFAAADDDPSSRFDEAPTRGPVSATVEPLSANANGDVTVVVELAGDPVAVVEAEKGRELSKSERSAIKKSLQKVQQPVVGAVEAEGGAVEATMQSAYNGVQATIPADAVDAVAALPNVVGVHAAGPPSGDGGATCSHGPLGSPGAWLRVYQRARNVSPWYATTSPVLKMREGVHTVAPSALTAISCHGPFGSPGRWFFVHHDAW